MNYDIHSACPKSGQPGTGHSAKSARSRTLASSWLSGLLLLGICSAQAASTSPEENWPQWRGPLGTGIAPKADPPVSWSETKNVKWKVRIPGKGTATPLVWGDKIFVQTAIATGKKIEPPADKPETSPVSFEIAQQTQPGPGRRRGGGGFGGGSKPTEEYAFTVLCLDRQTGKVLWQETGREEVPHEGHHRTDGGFASSSPVTDGKHLYAYFGSRGLYCYDLDGKLKWSEDLGDMRIALTFGEGSSPALYKDTLLVQWDHEGDSFVAALDKNTGKILWKQPRDERTSWSTPLVIEHEGRPQVITSATGSIRSYDPASGNLLWQCGGLTRNVIPTPVVGGGLLYATSGFQGNSLLAIRLGRTGDLTDGDAVAWSYKKSTPYVPSPLLYAGKLYFLAGNSQRLSCLDPRTGEVFIDAESLEGLNGVYASPVGANGRVYVVGRNGATAVIQPSDKLEVLATNQLDERFDASPAVVGNEIFLRGVEYLYCLANAKE
jgi:outer membrane protein assembly factor BamB